MKIEIVRKMSQVLGKVEQLATPNDTFDISGVSLKVGDKLYDVPFRLSFSLDFKGLKNVETHREDRGYKVPWLMPVKKDRFMKPSPRLIIPIEYADGFRCVGQAESVSVGQSLIYTYDVYEFKVDNFIESAGIDDFYISKSGVFTFLVPKSVRDSDEYANMKKVMADIDKTCGYTGLSTYALQRILRHYKLVKKRK